MAFYIEITLITIGIIFWIWTLVVACRTVKERKIMRQILEETRKDIDIIKNIIKDLRR